MPGFFFDRIGSPVRFFCALAATRALCARWRHSCRTPFSQIISNNSDNFSVNDNSFHNLGLPASRNLPIGHCFEMKGYSSIDSDGPDSDFATLAAEASLDAIKRAFEAGLSVSYFEGGRLYRHFHDGRVVEISDEEVQTILEWRPWP